MKTKTVYKNDNMYLEVRHSSKNAVLCVELDIMEELLERAICDIENDLGMNVGNPSYTAKIIIELEALKKRYGNLLMVCRRRGTSKIIT